MDWRRRVLPIAIHPQHDFAAEGFRLVRSKRVRQWELRAVNRANLTGGRRGGDQVVGVAGWFSWTALREFEVQPNGYEPRSLFLALLRDRDLFGVAGVQDHREEAGPG